MRSLFTAALMLSAATSTHAQTPTDSAKAKAVKVQTDSIRKETCRTGTLSASGLTCTSSGTTLAPRVSVLRRLANRIDSIVRPVAPPIPPVVYTVTLEGTPTDCDTVNMTLYPNGHWCRSVATVRDNNGTLQTITSANLVWTVTGDSSAVTHVRNGPDRYEVHSPTRSGYVILTARWSSGASVSKRITLIGPTTPPPIDTTTPPPTGAIGAAELPRVVPAYRDPYPGRACSVRVSPPMSLTAAAGAARGGAVLCLAVGVAFERPQIPARALGDTGWIVIRTDTMLPPEGVRMRPSMAAALRFAKIVTTLNGAPALTTTPGTFGWFLSGIEVTAGPAVTTLNAIMQLGATGAAQDTYAEVPQQIVLSQVYLHGTPLTDFQRCLYLNSGATAIVDSWFSECHGKGKDSQAIGSINGPGPYLIRNNYLEGAGENVLFGGATPSIPGMVAADITFTRNHVYTPVSWKTVWTKKNLLELKNAVRVSIDSSVFDGSWTDGQRGVALLFKSINDQGTCNWCRTTDVTVRRSMVKNVGSGISFSGAENYNSFGSVDSVAKRFLIQDVVLDSLNIAPYTGDGRGVQITGGTSDVVFDRTVMAGPLANAMVVDNNKPSPRTAFSHSVWTHGTYFATGNSVGTGLSAMTAGLPGFLWSGMTVVKVGTPNPLPAGTTVVTAESQAPLAAQIRTTVQQATAGVVIPP